MRIIISHHAFAAFAGTESYMLTIALELERLGHEVIVHAPEAGAMATFAGDRGVRVIEQPDALPAAIDAVLAQDAATAFVLSERYPDARRVFVAHSNHYALQSPPQLDGVCHRVVVLNDRVHAFVDALAAHPPIVRLRQPIDLRRFTPQGTANVPPRRALLLDNHMTGPLVDQLEGACRAAGLELVRAGVHSTPTPTPEAAIADADLVIGVGRSVLEGMAAGRAAFVYGIAGADGWVTPDRHAAFEADGFAGLATPDVIDGERLTAELRAWKPEMASANRRLAVVHHNIKNHAQELVALLHDLGTPEPPAPSPADELARLVRLEWQTWGMYRGTLEVNRDLRERVQQQLEALEAQRDVLEEQRDALEDGHRTLADQHHEILRLSDLRAELHDLLARSERERADAVAALEALRATRRVRWAERIAAPLDALRRRR